jgi:mannitol/fructose-specific phosphotransferase system IIA component (Ntr-type)
LVTTPETQSKNVTHPLINTLVQLQELILVRSEQDASQANQHLTQLNASIDNLLGSIPNDTRSLFQRIEKKDMLAIVPISNNVCSGCGLTLPVSLVYAVRAGEKLYQCTNCARILYYPEVRPRRINRKVPGRSEPRRTGIARFSSLSLMLPRLSSTDRDKVIEEMALKMESEGFVDNGTKLVDQVLDREAIISTAVDHGLAFPHARGVEGGGLALALGINHKGIKFNPLERTLTHIVFFLVIPTAASVFYLRLLAGLCQTFSKKDAREKLLAAQSAEELWQVLCKVTKNTVK